MEILELTRQIEARVLEIIDCKNRCVAAYNICETVADRYFTFDELTSRLGNGSRPVEGVKDWRQKVSTKCHNFFLLLNVLDFDSCC